MVDYEEIFAPVSNMTTVHTLLIVTLTKDCTLHLIDVKNAFLYDVLKEVMFMKPPPRSVLQRPNTIFHLRKYFDGLNHAPEFVLTKSDPRSKLRDSLRVLQIIFYFFALLQHVTKCFSSMLIILLSQELIQIILR